ncbi:hypothetical protein K0M31_018949, partial [Melipona bicolor]
MYDRSFVGVKFTAKNLRQVPIRLRLAPPWLELAVLQTAAIEHVSNAENGEQLGGEDLPEEELAESVVRCNLNISDRTNHRPRYLFIGTKKDTYVEKRRMKEFSRKTGATSTLVERSKRSSKISP